MEKSVFTAEYTLFLKHLRNARIKAQLTQKDVAQMIGQTQSFVSKCERGERRIDVIELYHFCKALKISLPDFVQQLAKFLKEEDLSA